MYVEERMYRLKIAQGDPDWQLYLAKSRPLMEEARMMKVAPFFMERLKKMLAAVK